MKNQVAYEFNPSKRYFLYHVRKGLYDAIQKHKHHLSGRMMDFGCGSMPYKSLFTVDEYIGVDFDNAGHPHETEIIDVFYNGKKIPFADNYFDSVLATEVIEHIFNIDELLLELNRVMKPNAKILITCPFVWDEHEIPYDYARYTHFSLKYLLEKAGFEIVLMDKAGNYVITIAQILNSYCVRVRFLNKFVYLINIVSTWLNTFLPKIDGLYLSNIVVARKK